MTETHDIFLADVSTYGSAVANLIGSNAIAYDKATGRTYIAYRSRNSSSYNYEIYVAYSTDSINWTSELATTIGYLPYTIAIGVDSNGRVCLAYSTPYSQFTDLIYSRNIIGIMRYTDTGWGQPFGITNITNGCEVSSIIADKFNVFHFILRIGSGAYHIDENHIPVPITTISIADALCVSYYSSSAISAVYDENSNTIIYLYDASDTYSPSTINFIEGSYSIDTNTVTQVVDAILVNPYDEYMTTWMIDSVGLAINSNGDLFATMNNAETVEDGMTWNTSFATYGFYKIKGSGWVKSNLLDGVLIETRPSAFPAWANNNEVGVYYLNYSRSLVKATSQNKGATFLTSEYIYQAIDTMWVDSLYVSNDVNMPIQVCVYAKDNNALDVIELYVYSYLSTLNIDITANIDNILNSLSAKSVNISITLAPPIITSVFKSGSSIIVMWEQRW